MGWGVAPALSLVPSTFDPSSSFFTSSSSSRTFHSYLCNSSSSSHSSSSNSVGSGPSSYNSRSSCVRFPHSHFYPSVTKKSELLITKQICRAAAEYKFPDPIPQFAEAETEKFSTHLLKKLSKKDIFGDSVEEVVGICSEIFSMFLQTEYGGPGTLLVVPFIDMADTLNERGLPGGPQAARAAIVWAQDHVDKDWNEWTGGDSSQ